MGKDFTKTVHPHGSLLLVRREYAKQSDGLIVESKEEESYMGKVLESGNLTNDFEKGDVVMFKLTKKDLMGTQSTIVAIIEKNEDYDVVLIDSSDIIAKIK